jgi:hypothetical protein
MYRRLSLSRILLAVIAIGATFGLYARAQAQEGIIKHLEGRLRAQQVPFTDISILSHVPLRIQIIIQSASDDQLAMPEDPVILHLAYREVLFASKDVLPINSLVRILLNQDGQVLFSADIPLDTSLLHIHPEPATKTDDAAAMAINESLDLRGLALAQTRIEHLDQFRTVDLLIVTPTRAEAEQAMPDILASLGPTLEKLNAEGAQIALCKIQVLDQDGTILVNYLMDTQLRSQTWWLADEFNGDWFPRPMGE